MAKFNRIRVIHGLNSRHFIGTIQYDKKFATIDDNTVFVKWDVGSHCTCSVGQKKQYDLLVYDYSVKDTVHPGFRCICKINESIRGTMWSCLKCPNLFMCNECYIINTIHKDHNFCRIDAPNSMGCFVGIRSASDSYSGIITGAKVQNTEKFSESFSGKVESITIDNKGKLTIEVKSCSEDTKKYYNSYTKLKLVDDESKEKVLVDVDRDQLRILGHNPIFNWSLYQHYKEKLDEFASSLELPEPLFNIGDKVYIDCFSPLDLINFQKGQGESNNEIENLIGISGTLVTIDTSTARIHYDSLDKEYTINIKSIFNSQTENQRIIRITGDIQMLKEHVKQWKSVNIKLDNKKWYLDDSILEMISGKVGVIILEGLPDNLVVVRFKFYRYSFGILLPKTVCIELTEDHCLVHDGNHIVFNDSDKDIILLNKCLIDDSNVIEFPKKIEELSNKEMWQEIFNYAMERNAPEFMKILIKMCNTELGVSEYLCKMLARDNKFPEDQMNMAFDVILEHTDLDFEMKSTDGCNLIQLASKNNYPSFITKVVSVDKYRDIFEDTINRVNSVSGFTAFHYAVVNNHVDVVRLLMMNQCNIYAPNRDGDSALHIALKHYYLEAFFTILEQLQDSGGELDVQMADNAHNTILHLAASRPNEDMLTRWKNVIENGKYKILNKLVEDLEDFSKKDFIKQEFDIKMESAFILSCLILKIGKNSSRVWNHETNKKPDQTPAKIFDDSIRDRKEDVDAVSVTNLLRFFKMYQYKNNEMKMCSFCKADFATVTYLPCGHTIHCIHCSFNLYRCNADSCNSNIDEKYIDQSDRKRKIYGFDTWKELAKNIHDIPYPETMNDWFKIIDILVQERLCQTCTAASVSECLPCGHCVCAGCLPKIDKCPSCQKNFDTSFTMKKNHIT